MRKLLIALLATATLPAAVHAQDDAPQTRDADVPARPQRARDEAPEPRFQAAEPHFRHEAVVETGFRSEAEPVASPIVQVSAQSEVRREREQRADRPNRSGEAQGRADGAADRRNNGGFRPDRPFAAPPAPPAAAPAQAQPPANAWQRDDRTRAARDRNGWTGAAQGRADWNRNDARPDNGRRSDWNGNDPRRQDWNRGNDDRRPDWNRNNDRRDWDRNSNDGRRDWDRNNNGRPDWNRDGWNNNSGRWNGNDRNFRSWDRGWRSNNRYDWQRYRSSNRFAFRLPRYYAPHGWNYGYRRFSIGATLYFGLFDQDYWIADPWQYRLPPVYWPYQWVRYYNDALLVDTRSGYVVDVIPDIFWY